MVTVVEEPRAAGHGAAPPADLLSLNREAVRSLHLLARELDDAVHAHCVHQPLAHARDELLGLAVRLQMALRDL